MTSKPTIDEELIRKVAELAQLEAPSEQLAALSAELRRMVELVSRLKNAFQSEDLDPALFQNLNQLLPLGDESRPDHLGGANRERPDQEKPSLSPDEATANAPAASGSAFQVPRIIE